MLDETVKTAAFDGFVHRETSDTQAVLVIFRPSRFDHGSRIPTRARGRASPNQRTLGLNLAHVDDDQRLLAWRDLPLSFSALFASA